MSMFSKQRHFVWIGLFALILTGCGTTKARRATEQLLLSDAVDRSIASMDFSALAGESVYLDTTYVKSVKGINFVNADYIISSLRQQMVASNCRLEDSLEAAEYVVEARVGALGTDSHDVVYGIPASNLLSNAASLVPNAPPIPMIPEISLAKKQDEVAAAKIAVFAYHRESREPIWQSGLAEARSTSKDTWILGAGPFRSGTIHHDRTRFAGEELGIPLLHSLNKPPEADRQRKLDSYTKYNRESFFARTPPKKLAPQESKVQPARFEEPAGGANPATKTPAAKTPATKTPAAEAAAPETAANEAPANEAPANEAPAAKAAANEAAAPGKAREVAKKE